MKMRYVAYCDEGLIGDVRPCHRHSICREDVSNPDHATRAHECFVEVIAATGEEAEAKAEQIADALNNKCYAHASGVCAAYQEIERWQTDGRMRLGDSILRRVDELMAKPHGMACGGTCDTCKELKLLNDVVNRFT